MRILITGISGFVGHYLLDRLHEGNKIYGIGHVHIDSHLHSVKGLKLFKTDLRDLPGMIKDVREARPEKIFHLGGIASVKMFDHNIRDSFDINTVGSLNVFEAVREAKNKSTVVYISSGEVYGVLPKDQLPMRESYPLNPGNLYGASKASAELVARNYWSNYGVKIIILRPFNHIGPGQATDFVTASFASQLAQIKKGKKKPVLEVGNLHVKRDFTDVRDIVRAYDIAADKCSAGEVYNVSSGKLYTIGDILDIMISHSGLKVKVKESRDRLRKRDITHVWGCPEKFMKKTGWKPKYKIEDTLKGLLDNWIDKI